MRRFGEAVVAGKPYRDRPGAYGILADGAWLLVARTDGKGENYLLPGGGIDPGESPLQALHREVMEETGWRIGAARKVASYQRYVYMPDYGYWARKVCGLYMAKPILPISDPIEPDHYPEWMHIDTAAKHLSVDAERQLVKALFGR